MFTLLQLIDLKCLNNDYCLQLFIQTESYLIDHVLNISLNSMLTSHPVTLLFLRGVHERLVGNVIELALDPHVNKTGDIWHICIEVVIPPFCT